ncbi:hypothetical protein RRG08_013109 [Elysia crispata]|uniref:Uncharacterized protein n=1 Tax=Elysia crispata TaxID=231223 RepID=A0AAE1DRC6_9GAST|nr:hypothetical protein RRG08_013109 [Elysia crispata]
MIAIPTPIITIAIIIVNVLNIHQKSNSHYQPFVIFSTSPSSTKSYHHDYHIILSTSPSSTKSYHYHYHIITSHASFSPILHPPLNLTTTTTTSLPALVILSTSPSSTKSYHHH